MKVIELIRQLRTVLESNIDSEVTIEDLDIYVAINNKTKNINLHRVIENERNRTGTNFVRNGTTSNNFKSNLTRY